MFVRLVSHEIRTPLNIVIGGLDLLSKKFKDCVEDPEVLDIISDSRSSCDSAVDILSDLLAYEKLDADAMTLEKSLIPVWSLIESSTRPFRMQACQCWKLCPFFIVFL